MSAYTPSSINTPSSIKLSSGGDGASGVVVNKMIVRYFWNLPIVSFLSGMVFTSAIALTFNRIRISLTATSATGSYTVNIWKGDELWYTRTIVGSVASSEESVDLAMAAGETLIVQVIASATLVNARGLVVDILEA